MSTPVASRSCLISSTFLFIDRILSVAHTSLWDSELVWRRKRERIKGDVSSTDEVATRGATPDAAVEDAEVATVKADDAMRTDVEVPTGGATDDAVSADMESPTSGAADDAMSTDAGAPTSGATGGAMSADVEAPVSKR